MAEGNRGFVHAPLRTPEARTPGSLTTPHAICVVRKTKSFSVNVDIQPEQDVDSRFIPSSQIIDLDRQ